MKSFNITSIVSTKRHPVYVHSWWKKFVLWLQGRKTNPIASYELTVAIDSHRGLHKGDVFVGQGATAWKIIDIRISAGLPTGPQYLLDIRSWKPIYHCAILGPAIPVVSPSKDWRL
jgi:hypothetical protein